MIITLALIAGVVIYSVLYEKHFQLIAFLSYTFHQGYSNKKKLKVYKSLKNLLKLNVQHLDQL